MNRGLCLALLLTGSLGWASAPKTVPEFQKSCVERGGEFIAPHTIMRLGPVEVPASCGFGHAADGALVCSPQSDAGDDCSRCQHPAECAPAAGDFGPLVCRCATWGRIETFAVPPRITLELLELKGPGGYALERPRLVLEQRLRSLRLCLERGLGSVELGKPSVVVSTLSVSEHGAVTAVELTKDESGLPAMRDCLAILTRVVLPSSPHAAKLELSLRLAPIP